MCGACCSHIDRSVAILRLIGIKPGDPLDFPHQFDETGRCEKLGEDNKCTVYEDRPVICNLDKMLEILGIDKKQGYIENIKACNRLMDEDGIDESFRIKEGGDAD